MFPLLYLIQCACFGINNEASHRYVFGYEGMGADNFDSLPDTFLCVLETLQPVVQVNAAFADGVEGLVGNTSGTHFFVAMVATHMAGAAM